MAIAVAFVSVGFPLGTLAQQNTASQDVSAAGGLVLEEVIVVARRREENLQDVPISISALSEQFLREQRILELSDLGINVPSLSVSVGGNYTNAPVISLRGLRPSESLISLDPAVPLYFAEVVLTPTQGSNLAMYDLANVQVLKGPQGTLFGRNSTGGAVLLTPNRPGDELGGYVQAEVGDYNLYHFEAAVDLPVNETVQFRLAGRSLDRDGYQSNVADNSLRSDDEFWDEDSYGVRLSMNLDISDRFNNLTIVSYDENETMSRNATPLAWQGVGTLPSLVDGRFNQPTAAEPDGALNAAVDRAFFRDDWTKTETDVDAFEKVENWIVVNTTQYDLSENLSVKNIFGYRKMDYDQSNDADGTALPVFGSITDVEALVTLNPELGTISADQYSNELQLIGTSFDDRLDWIVGAYWYEMEGSTTTPTQLLGANAEYPGFVILQDSPKGDAKNTAWSLFSEATYHFNDQWALTVGARGTWDEREVTPMNERSGPGGYGCIVEDREGNVLPDDACARTENKDFSKPTWRTNVTYTPTEVMMLYASVATGYRTGGFNLRGNTNEELTPFDEETVITYELGAKADWELGALGLLRTNLAVYTNQFDDLQQTRGTVSGGGFGTATVNAGEAEINGLELELSLSPTENLSFALSYSYVDASFKENDVQEDTNGDGEFDTVVDRSYYPFVWIPENTLTSSITYTLPLDAGIGEVSGTAALYWQDDMYSWERVDDVLSFADPASSEYRGWDPAVAQRVDEVSRVDDYTLLNLRLDWRGAMGSDFDLAIWVQNATDEQYAVGGLDIADSLGLVARVYGPPRTYGATFQWNFR